MNPIINNTIKCLDLQIDVDASNVPSKYALTILSECAAFPRRLIFFLKGSLTVLPGRMIIPSKLY